MSPVILRCSALMFGLLIGGAVAPLSVLRFIATLGWPPITQWIIAGVAVFMAIYALTLLPTELVLSDEGLCQTQLLSKLRLRWTQIAEWRYIRVQDRSAARPRTADSSWDAVTP